MKILTLWLLLLPWAAQAVELEINIVPHEEHGGVKFTGKTNFPTGTRMVVKLSGEDFDEEQLINIWDGSYKTKLFAKDNGESLKGEYMVSLIAEFNEETQRWDMLSILRTYQGPMISDKGFSARAKVTLEGTPWIPAPSPPPPPRQSIPQPPIARPSLPDRQPPEIRPQPRVQQPPSRNYDADADLIVALINSQYGRVCQAELTGWWSKTLKIDWTVDTKKIHAIKVLAEIGSVKEQLYADGVRYFQFPNDAGGYNVIDWKTGEKTSISDRAPYFFR